jgi:hypothetical protein
VTMSLLPECGLVSRLVSTRLLDGSLLPGSVLMEGLVFDGNIISYEVLRGLSWLW